MSKETYYLQFIDGIVRKKVGKSAVCVCVCVRVRVRVRVRVHVRVRVRVFV